MIKLHRVFTLEIVRLAERNRSKHSFGDLVHVTCNENL